MHSNLPKVLHPIAGKALVAHVIDTARSLSPQTLCVWSHGHGGDAVRTTLAAPDLAWALQEPQLGTGHAVQQALPQLSGRRHDARPLRRRAADPGRRRLNACSRRRRTR